jgi:hypothetical protein
MNGTYKVMGWKGHAMAISPTWKARVTHYIALISGVLLIALLSPVIAAYLIYVAIVLRPKRGLSRVSVRLGAGV